MHEWLETLGVLILADFGIILGLLTKRLKKRFWILCYLPPLMLILAIALTRHFYRLGFYPPFSWIIDGRREYVIFAFTIPMVFSMLIPKLTILRQKIVLIIFVTIASVIFFIIPFFSPILIRHELENLQTEYTSDGICVQGTDYTCGPAAAATALYQLGITASEGELAIMAHTTPQTGTSDDLLKEAIEKLYGPEGVTCTYRYFNSVEELKGNCPVIVVTKFSFMIDHYITVLDVSDNKVIVGNLSAGKEDLTYDEFRKIWRSVGIIVKLNSKTHNF